LRLLRTHCIPDQPTALRHDARKLGRAGHASDDSEGHTVELVGLDCRGRQWISSDLVVGSRWFRSARSSRRSTRGAAPTASVPTASNCRSRRPTTVRRRRRSLGRGGARICRGRGTAGHPTRPRDCRSSP
jgi:GAF domain-containing protein